MNGQQEMLAWCAWREACALALISEPERDHLAKVIAVRFRSRVRQINLHGQGNLSAPNDADCAHLFETYCAMHGRRDGKKYKHWLLTRGRRDVDTVQSGVMLLIRNVVREWVRDAYPQTAELSLQQIIRSKKTLEQLLPSSAPDQRSSEQTDWLTQKLSSDLAKMDSIEQVVLLLRAQGRVFSAPGIQAEFGVGKTTLHKYHRQILEREAAELSDHFPGLSVEDASALVLDLLDGWGKQLFSNFLAENTGTPAFKKVKEPEDA